MSTPTSTFTTAPSPTEQLVEEVAALHFAAIGAAIQRGVEIDAAGERADSSQCILPGRLTAALQRLNPDLPRETVEGVARTLARPPHPTLVQNNRWFHTLLVDGVEVEYRDARSGPTDHALRGGRARLIDFADPDANDLLVVRQLAVTGPSGKVIRLDLTVFLNGLPIAVIELKDPTDPEADLGAAIDQIDRYQHTAPDLFAPNLARVVSDGLLTRVGSITSGRGRFLPWRPLHDQGDGAPTLEALIRGLFAPPAHTMYLDKPLAGHNLMQAIARVNRVWGDKPGGLIVDLLGLADSLADALATYTQAGGTGEAVRPVRDEAVPAMQTAYEKLRDFFHGCDYAPALGAEPREVLPVYLRAIDHVLGQNDGWKRFRGLVKELSTAFALAAPRPETEALAPHLAFFQRAAAMIRKRLADDGGRGEDRLRQRDIDAAVRQVIGGAVDADEVIDLFAVAGLSEARLDILSDEFLGRVAALEQKNLALETLRKLLNAQIRNAERTNIVRSRKFREALEDAMRRYTNKAITTAEMIARLIDLAKSLREAQRHGEALGLSAEEIAFYDALADNASARDVMRSDTLRLMARELTEMVRRMPRLDWTQRESVRANLRRNVRRLLARYGYPPDLAEGATQLVLRQAELSTENGA